MAIQNFLREVRFYVVFYKIIDYNGTRQKINEKYITKKIIKKESRKYSTSTYLTALSNRTVKKESGEGGPQRKKMNIYLKQKKETISKQWS